jgi:adenylate cyclase
MARCVFDHGGTLDDYLGDEVMAVFGTPAPDPSDPARALACGSAITEEVERWHAKRSTRGGFPVSVGVGIYVGEVVVGNTGDERRLKFAVVGDTINLASRLERLTRTFGAALVVGGDLLTKAPACRRPGRAVQPVRRTVAPAATRTRARARRQVQHRSSAIPAAATNL